MKYRWTEADLRSIQRVRGGLRGAEERSPAVDSQHKSSPSHYKSKLEVGFALRLKAMERAGEIEGYLYEPFTFRLASGKRYRVDFMTWGYKQYTSIDGGIDACVSVITCYECKGWHKNYRDALTHLKWASQKFPFFHWKKVVRNGKSGFEIYDVVV